jgi:F-type H+-transporting ATPase subunit delta
MKTNLETQAIVEGLVDYLKSKQALDLLPQIIEELTQRTWGKVDPNLAVVSAPIKLTSAQIKEIGKHLTQLMQRPIRVKAKLDKEIVGGFLIEVGGQMIDATLDGQLKDLKQKIIYG